MKKLYTKVACTLVGLASMVPVASATLIDTGDNPGNVRDVTGGTGSLRELGMRFLNYFLGFLGIVAVGIIIYGGVLYVTSAGQQDKADNAKKLLTYAVIGLIIVLLSFAIVNTVISGGGGVEPV